MKSAISFYTPMLIEEQLNLKENFSGNYLMDFRVSSNTSEAMIKAMSSFIYESVPMTRISDNYSERGVSLLNNKVLAKEIPPEAKKTTYGERDWAKETNQGLYSDLLIECNFEIPDSKKLEVYWSITSAVYVEVSMSSNSILGVSPLLASMIETWKAQNNGASPKDKDFFGTTRGISGVYVQGNPTSEDGEAFLEKGYNSGTAKVSFNSNLVFGLSAGRGAVFEHSPGKYKVYLAYPEPSYDNMASPVVGLMTSLIPMDIYKQGGSTTTSTVTGPQANLTITQKNAEGPLRGRALAGNFITATFPGPLTRTTVADSYGVWSIDYPESPLEQEQLDQIEVTQSSESGGGFSSNTTVAPTVQTSYGLPILKQVDRSLPGGMYGRISNLVEKGSPSYSYSEAGVSGYYKFTKTSPKYILTGLYVGRVLNSPSSLANRTGFLSKPGAVINQIGMEVNYGARLVDKTRTTRPGDSDLYPNEVLLASATKPSYETTRRIFSLSYELENMNTVKERYRISYEKSYENSRDIYTLKWGLFTELAPVTQKWRLSWDSDMPFKTVTEYYMRFEVKLPDEVLTKQFYTVSWDRDLSDSYVQLMKMAYEVDQYRPRIYTWKFNWETVLIDQAVIKPYYVKRSVGGKFVDCISFQVYVDYAYAETFMATNRMFFYFSNPPKYELIQFDYNMRPYEDVFMEDLKDPGMNNRDDVPERFVFLGNYTIKDVDINNSFSLDILAEENQMNEHRSYWVPENLEDYESTMITLKDGKSKALPLDYKFRDDHHTDIVELDLVILTGAECCFTQKSIGSRCSPY